MALWQEYCKQWERIAEATKVLLTATDEMDFSIMKDYSRMSDKEYEKYKDEICTEQED